MKIVPRKLRKLGTTLVETLPPIGLAGFLAMAASLLPELSKTRGLSKRAKSINNQKQIGMAYVSYAQDNNDYYPEVFGFAGVGGKPGDFTEMVNPGRITNERNSVYGKEYLQRMKNAVTTAPNVVASIYGATTPAEKRPLNEYLNNNFKIFHDPADVGGTVFNLDSCYRAFGNSYQPQVADDFFRVKRVLGERTEDAGTPYRGPGWQKGQLNHSDKSEKDDPYAGRSMRQSEMINPSNKIIQGDWNWPFDQGDAWHAKKGEGGHVMLYGDGHVEYYVFPPSKILMQWFTPTYQANKDGDARLDAQGDPLPDDEAFRKNLAQLHSNPPPDSATGKPDPTWKNLNVLQYQEIGGRPAKYIDTGFDWW